MNSRLAIFIIVPSILAGFLGGLMSNQIFSTKSAYAKDESKPQKLIIAENFHIVNSKGITCAILRGSVDKDGDPKAELRLLTPSLEKGFKSGLILDADKKGAYLNLYGPGNSSVVLEAEDKNGNDTANFSLWSNSLWKNIGFDVDSNRTSISIYDKDGRERVVIGNVSLLDVDTGIQQTHPVSSTVLFNAKGKVLWSAP